MKKIKALLVIVFTLFLIVEVSYAQIKDPTGSTEQTPINTPKKATKLISFETWAKKEYLKSLKKPTAAPTSPSKNTKQDEVVDCSFGCVQRTGLIKECDIFCNCMVYNYPGANSFGDMVRGCIKRAIEGTK